MYKSFHSHIKHFSLVTGYLNLLRSFYIGSAQGNIEDKNYIIANQAVILFKEFCKKTIDEIEELLSEQNSKTTFRIKDLDKINKLINSTTEPASEGMVEEIAKHLEKIKDFIDFLINDFPKKTLNQVDLREIKSELTFFKYQTYLS